MTTSVRAQRFSAKLLVIFLVLGIILTTYLSIIAGQLELSPAEIGGSLLHAVGIEGLLPRPSHEYGEVTLWVVRFPRIAMALLVGIGLAVSGVLLQGVFANPLAEPGVIGVSSGAAVGASAAIALGGTGSVAATSSFVGLGGVTLAAFITGLATALFVYLASRQQGRTEVVMLILIGISVNAVAGALIALFTFIANPASREQIIFWQMGSLSSSQWTSVVVVLLLSFPTIIVALKISPKLDLLSLGDAGARHLGVNIERLRATVIILVAILISASVAFTGIIAFVGLVVPHLIRGLIGPSHRMLLIASALGGGLTLLLSDLLARTLIDNSDLPLGMVTAIIGGPVFFFILRRSAKVTGW